MFEVDGSIENASSERKEVKGVLWFLCFSLLILWPIGGLINEYYTYQFMKEHPLWGQLKWLRWSEMAGTAVLIVFGFYTGYGLLMTRREQAVRLAKYFFISSFGFRAIMVGVSYAAALSHYSWPASTPQSISENMIPHYWQLATSFVVSVAWLYYLNVSKRVKETYTENEPTS